MFYKNSKIKQHWCLSNESLDTIILATRNTLLYPKAMSSAVDFEMFIFAWILRYFINSAAQQPIVRNSRIYCFLYDSFVYLFSNLIAPGRGGARRLVCRRKLWKFDSGVRIGRAIKLLTFNPIGRST